ncbi:DUF421 domain-containing protein [Caproicibacter sp.]|uniref:DUF421 domain-containing protein n=1 Tax=Caproicibacter sp. TaxID=2814884 RepID=UPI00398964CC
MIGILETFLRSAAAFLLLMLVTRLMGKKAISQMTFFDFCVGITLGSVTTEIGLTGNDSMGTAIVMLFTLAGLTILTGYLHLKSMKFRKAVNSEPLMLIENGRIVEANLKKARITLNDLTSLLREKNAFNIADVNNAVLENDGKLSVQLKSGKKPVTPSELQLHPPEKGLTRDIVIDGILLNENLEATNLTKEWLYEELKKQGFSNLKEVFFAALDSSGSLYVSKGMKGKEQPGQHGIE